MLCIHIHYIVFLNCCHYTLHYASDWLEMSDLGLLTQELRPTQQKWESIGDELPHYFDAGNIHRQYSDQGDCLREILRGQLQHSIPTTWRNIVDALRSPGVRESQLADELEAKFCPSEFINNLLFYFSEYSAILYWTWSTAHKVQYCVMWTYSVWSG